MLNCVTTAFVFQVSLDGQVHRIHRVDQRAQEAEAVHSAASEALHFGLRPHPDGDLLGDRQRSLIRR